MTSSVTLRSMVFLGLAFAASWGVVIAGWRAGANETPQTAMAVLAAMMAGPALAAFICAMLFEKSRRFAALGLTGKPNPWWIFAWLIGLALAAGSVAATILLSGRTFTDIGVGAMDMARAQLGDQAAALPNEPPDTLMIVAASVFFGAAVNSVMLTFTEELGWRGYLHGLWRGAGFWKSSIATGFFWGVWHAPAILLFGHNYPDNREIGVALFTLFCVLLSPVMALVRDRGGSVLAAGILHGTINATGALTVLAVSNSVFPWTGLVGIGGFIALAASVVFVIAVGGGRARRQAPAAPDSGESRVV
jgi:uncharacterized protein